MEKVSDFFSELKERLSNPFILSYLVAWCIWNHEIIVVLVFYKSSELKSIDFKSFLDVIHYYSSTWNFLWMPLISALGYTVLFPVLKNWILAYGAYSDKWGNDWNMRISKTRTIPLERYLLEKKKYDDLVDQLAKFANEEKELKIELKGREAQNQTLIKSIELIKEENLAALSDMDVQLNLFKSKITHWEHINSSSVLWGEWILVQTSNIGSTKVENKYAVVCVEKTFNFTDKDGIQNRLIIENICCDNINLVVFFEGKFSGDRIIYNIWHLKIVTKEINALIGTNQKGENITLRKKPQLSLASQISNSGNIELST